MCNIAVIDLGTGNLRSVYQAIQKVGENGQSVRVTDSPSEIRNADRVVFPGQSAIGSCMEKMRSHPELLEAINHSIREKPFLGICIGLQALFHDSEEDGGVECMGVLKGAVKHFRSLPDGKCDLVDANSGRALKIPHMGWNNVKQTQSHSLWQGIPDTARFYFVHSFCAVSESGDETYGVTEYGCPFTAAAGVSNLFAVQFHPEKSQANGLRLLKNFIQWDGVR